MDCCKDNIEIMVRITDPNRLAFVFGWTHDQTKLYELNLDKEVPVYSGNMDEVSKMNLKLVENGISFKNKKRNLK